MCETQCGLPTLPANTRRWPNAGLKLTHCLRRWPSNKPALVQCLVFAVLRIHLVRLDIETKFLTLISDHVKKNKFVSISNLTGECAAKKIKNFCRSSLWTCVHHMVIFRSQNKITDFLMILSWACPFKAPDFNPRPPLHSDPPRPYNEFSKRHA